MIEIWEDFITKFNKKSSFGCVIGVLIVYSLN